MRVASLRSDERNYLRYLQDGNHCNLRVHRCCAILGLQELSESSRAQDEDPFKTQGQ